MRRIVGVENEVSRGTGAVSGNQNRNLFFRQVSLRRLPATLAFVRVQEEGLVGFRDAAQDVSLNGLALCEIRWVVEFQFSVKEVSTMMLEKVQMLPFALNPIVRRTRGLCLIRET